MLNGDGLRCVLFVSGCAWLCPDCQNPITHNPEYGLEFDQSALLEIFNELFHDYISGLTISGGDPLFPSNREAVETICQKVKSVFPDKTIWLYTGYKWEAIRHLNLLRYVDVLVDGRFEKDKADINYHWAGSTNQRVIDVQSSLMEGKVVLHSDAIFESHNGQIPVTCGCG